MYKNHEIFLPLSYLNTTDFIAYDPKFFELIGPNATVEHVQNLAYQSHKAPCYIKETNELFFVDWGPPGGDDGVHSWQYVLDIETNELRKVETTPPTYNAHGCVYYNQSLYVVTDGYADKESGALVKVNPRSWERETLVNNYLVQPFAGFNDLEMDREGNFWVTDSKSGWGRGITTFTPPTLPSIYFIEHTTLRSKVVQTTTGNANGYFPRRKDPYGERELWAFDVSESRSVLSKKRLLNNPISYFYDGVRVSRGGWIFAGAGDGVDVIDPENGFTVGSVRMGGGENLAVSLAFGENEIWIVGRGGVWRVKGVRERLAREW
ncbi:hypothetical protein P170DRAFT_442771 [Aspergillus steynii IBT 23096]|uniref:SMP-30/Gluconolactonase/LRE-like region domain-containing protein n=1 Tax=Aspergillus steynii IBT 23096 TaxID=1392250 RepID=A0A2I2GPC6_9EURO|nr:uncharacterized protein P170DRAFT_442771 [Aspergillus steynii IBT 23096]PLB54732.1 hypothetical protein P170DRAFT_442771 [Aspergillus steynii IBT 23096]